MSTRTLISPASLRGRIRYGAALLVTTALFVLVFFFPLYWMIAGAVKHPTELALPTPTFFPQSFHPESYLDAWTKLRIAHYFTNTVLYALGGWLLQIVFDVAVAYALSKLRPVLGWLVLGMMLASLMLPAAALLVPGLPRRRRCADRPRQPAEHAMGAVAAGGLPTRSTSIC